MAYECDVGGDGHLLGADHALPGQTCADGLQLGAGADTVREGSGRVQDDSNIEIINDLSERALPVLLPKIRGDVNFWLDGHYSHGVTHKGPNETPIIAELEAISSNLRRWPQIAVLIDDVRDFTGMVQYYDAYPTLDFLVDWSRAHGLSWHIEHDIFVARRIQN